MSAAPRLTGYEYSVYTRAVRMALVGKGVVYTYDECNPFDVGEAERLRDWHPFGRVPVLTHGDFHLWETQAILDYVDEVFDGPALTPGPVTARARMRQVMGIVDSYSYWPLVRQAFSHAVFHPLVGEAGEADTIHTGMVAAPQVLTALEEIAAEGEVLQPGKLCLSGCLLWPMLDYFSMIPQGQAMLDARPALADWMGWIKTCPAARETRPTLPDPVEKETSC